MKNDRARQNFDRFTVTAPLDDGQESEDDFRDGERDGLPKGWQQLLNDTRGARLYRIAPANGGDVAWQVEMIVNGEVQRRRCTSELRARAWLAVWDKPCFTLSIPDSEELNWRFRAGFFRRE
jgi:hypothetical protein